MARMARRVRARQLVLVFEGRSRSVFDVSVIGVVVVTVATTAIVVASGGSIGPGEASQGTLHLSPSLLIDTHIHFSFP